jgi:hypothetical protein
MILLCLLILVACNPKAEPGVDYQLGELIYQDHFDANQGWENFGYLDNEFGISEGVYNAISSGGGYITVTNEPLHSNVVIEVSVEQRSKDNNNSYGVVCRVQAVNTNIGYYFLISGNGEYGIRIGETGRIRVLVPWTEHPAIKRGMNQNKLRVVCIDDYLALYINDEFITEARYDWLTEGQLGFTVNSVAGVAVAIQFDDLKIWDASLVGTEITVC